MDLAGVPTVDPLEMALERELRPGERLLWNGRPLRRTRASHFGLWLFAIPWTAFALFWTGAAFYASQAGWDSIGGWGLVFPLFGVPFVAVGLGMLAVPLIPLFAADRTVYAVTDQRLILLYLGKRLKTKSVAGTRIGTIERSERSDGSGSLKIAIGSKIDSDGDRQVETFEIGEVRDVMAVEGKVRALMERGRGSISSSASNPS